MATLYELNEKLRDFEFEIDEETGEILNADDLDNLEIERDEKIENIALFIKNLKSDAEAYKREKEVFTQKQNAAKNKAERLKEYLAEQLQGEKFKTDRVTISWRKSEGVVIDPLKLDTKGDWMIPQEPKIDKTRIRELLKKGEVIRGAELEERQNIQIK